MMSSLVIPHERKTVGLLVRRGIRKLWCPGVIFHNRFSNSTTPTAHSSTTAILAFIRRTPSRTFQTFRVQNYLRSCTNHIKTIHRCSSLATAAVSEYTYENENDDHIFDENETLHRHCKTCTCDETPILLETPKEATLLAPCGALKTEYDTTPYPEPLPEPEYSVRRRLLSSETLALQSTIGQERLIDSLQQGTATSYISLTQQFLNQAEPAYCGITTACMVLNALEMDCVFRWKGGWRYYADENILLAHCHGCWSQERLRRAGITVQEFHRLVQCQGLDSTLKYPTVLTQAGGHSLDEFRKDIQQILSSSQSHRSLLVVSFGRSALGQTGDGHFSPVAAYHAATDSVLVLDVARYKYPPYWVSVPLLYAAMQPLDASTKHPRGWFNLRIRAQASIHDENRRPAHLVPIANRDPHPCPMHKAQVLYCPNKEGRPQ